jgi:cytochrome c oxidase subunit 2
MIPGRTTRLRVDPTQSGTFRAPCAEYCGASHAFMSLYAVVVTREEFDVWLAQQAADALLPSGPRAMNGERLFLSHGCPACHTVRGTPARGVIGPDLTHLAGRVSLGAARLDAGDFENWLTHVAELKPEVRMPSFAMLSADQLADLGAYLNGLR